MENQTLPYQIALSFSPGIHARIFSVSILT